MEGAIAAVEWSYCDNVTFCPTLACTTPGASWCGIGSGCTHLHRARRMAARGRPRAGTIARSDRARTRATGRPWGTARSGACNDTGAGSESHDAFGPDLDRAVTARLAANLVLIPSILVRVRPRQRPRRDRLRRKGCSWWGDRNGLARPRGTRSKKRKRSFGPPRVARPCNRCAGG